MKKILQLFIPNLAYKTEMIRCFGPYDLYYWKSGCNDGVRDCVAYGEDEDRNNPKCAKDTGVYIFNNDIFLIL